MEIINKEDAFLLCEALMAWKTSREHLSNDLMVMSVKMSDSIDDMEKITELNEYYRMEIAATIRIQERLVDEFRNEMMDVLDSKGKRRADEPKDICLELFAFPPQTKKNLS